MGGELPGREVELKSGDAAGWIGIGVGVPAGEGTDMHTSSSSAALLASEPTLLTLAGLAGLAGLPPGKWRYFLACLRNEDGSVYLLGHPGTLHA